MDCRVSHQPRQFGWGCLCEPGWGSSFFCGFAALCKGALEGPRVGLGERLGCGAARPWPHRAGFGSVSVQEEESAQGCSRGVGRKSVCSGQRLLMSNEQRSQDNKVWGRGEVRVVSHVNFSGYSFETVILGPREQYPCSSVCLSPHGQSILFCRAHSTCGVTLFPCHPMDTASLGQE